MSNVAIIRLSIGVPEVGTPSVFRVTVERNDSIGPVERSMNETEQQLVSIALLSFMLKMLE